MKKLILIGVLIIIGFLTMVIIMGYLGRYPSFFPAFIKYNKFLPQIVTQEVFKIENFMDPEEDFSAFLKEVEKTVHERWHKDAKLVYINFFIIPEMNKEIVSYELIFRRQYSISSEEWPVQINDLNVFYNATLTVEKRYYNFSKYSFINQLSKYKSHINELVDNQTLTAMECFDKFLCKWLPSINVEEMELSEIKISGKEALELALIQYPEIKERKYPLIWPGSLRNIDNIPTWIIIHSPPIKINATTGEILEKKD